MSSFHFPIPYILANDRVKLIPFEPDLHSVALVAQLNAYPELLAHMPGEPFRSIKELKALLQTPSNSLFSLPNPAHLLFAIIDKTSQTPSPEDEEGQLAGTIAYMNASKSDRSVEIGFVTIFPSYQKTHVTVNALGLLLDHAYAPQEQGGLGLVRTEWRCSTVDEASIGVAETLGYERVGLIPYHVCFPQGSIMGKAGNGKPLPPGSDMEDLWRDTIVYSMTWERWEEVWRGVVDLMDRVEW